MTVLLPIGKQSRYPALQLTVIHTQERDVSPGRLGIERKLLTSLPVQSRTEAIEKFDWYAMRWKIETFHKVLKSGCKAEDSKLRTADRRPNLISVFCILIWRILWLAMISRCAPQLQPRQSSLQRKWNCSGATRSSNSISVEVKTRSKRACVRSLDISLYCLGHHVPPLCRQRLIV
jgi:hypothetical protein